MIKHTVIFKLKYAPGSNDEEIFFDAAKKLAAIHGVQNFECLKQVSKKNNFDFGLSMQFADQESYDTYNIHPDHIAFIQQHWIPSVTDFMEIDYELIYE